MIKIGTSGFSYPDWIGSVYPEDLPERLYHVVHAVHVVVMQEDLVPRHDDLFAVHDRCGDGLGQFGHGFGPDRTAGRYGRGRVAHTGEKRKPGNLPVPGLCIAWSATADRLGASAPTVRSDPADRMVAGAEGRERGQKLFRLPGAAIRADGVLFPGVHGLQQDEFLAAGAAGVFIERHRTSPFLEISIRGALALRMRTE